MKLIENLDEIKKFENNFIKHMQHGPTTKLKMITKINKYYMI